MPDEGDSGVRAPACIHVDLDSVWATAASCGVEMDMDPDPILQTSVGRFISIFAEHRVRATFFITGRDAGRRSNAPLIAALRSAGHEIANHSMAHRPNFTGLPAREIEADIADSTKAVEDAVGERCLGFRAPTYNVNGAVLRRLEGLGYLYDSSILPTFISPLYRAANRLAGGRAFPYGDPRHWAAPLVPYHPDEARVWRRGGMRIAEVPISTMPFLRLPFHASYVFQLGMPLFRAGWWLSATAGTPLVYVFHARELADDGGGWMRLLPFRAIPLGRRTALYRKILGAITRRYDVVETRALARAAG